jgi:hypothetical protein
MIRGQNSTQKTKTLKLKDGFVVAVVDRLLEDGSTHHFEGHPTVQLADTYIRIGCIRIERSVIRLLAHTDKWFDDEGIVQVGDYKSKDPEDHQNG